MPENISDSRFDSLYGEGTLRRFLPLIKSQGITPEAVDHNHEYQGFPFYGRLDLIWRRDNPENNSYWRINYSANNWHFAFTKSGIQGEHLLDTMSGLMTSFAKEIGIESFTCNTDTPDIENAFLKYGFEKSADGPLVCNLKDGLSRIEEYSAWADNGKDPDLEPAWRKEV